MQKKKKWTYDGIVEALTQRPARWSIDDGRCLRTSVKRWRVVRSGPSKGKRRYVTKECCPLTFLCLVVSGKFFDIEDYRDAAEVVGVTQEMVRVIINAADTRSGNLKHTSAVARARRQMLKALGLKEPAKEEKELEKAA